MMDPKTLALVKQLQALGEEVEIDEEDARVYLPDISDTPEMRNFYIPKVSKGFYTGCFERLRELSMPRLRGW